jgi:hypothetical protein
MSYAEEKKTHPIVLSGAEVRAVLDGKKTQMRRIIKVDPSSRVDGQAMDPHELLFSAPPDLVPVRYHRGDGLWVRETWAHDAESIGQIRTQTEDVLGSNHGPYYRADGTHENSGIRWQPSISMPRWASRLTLDVTDVRVERLQDITEDDARSEGCDEDGPVGYIPAMIKMGNCRYQFANEWAETSIGKKHPWDINPWVWVVSFRKAKR